MKEIKMILPTAEEIFLAAIKFNLPKRLRADGTRSNAMRISLGEYAEKKGCYVHYWEKNEDEKIIIYVGQTSKSYASRLNFEFTMSRKPVSVRFREKMTEHINAKHTIYTVLIPSDSEIMNRFIAPEYKSEKDRRLLMEQALITIFDSDNLLNSTQ